MTERISSEELLIPLKEGLIDSLVEKLSRLPDGQHLFVLDDKENPVLRYDPSGQPSEKQLAAYDGGKIGLFEAVKFRKEVYFWHWYYYKDERGGRIRILLNYGDTGSVVVGYYDDEDSRFRAKFEFLKFKDEKPTYAKGLFSISPRPSVFSLHAIYEGDWNRLSFFGIKEVPQQDELPNICQIDEMPDIDVSEHIGRNFFRIKYPEIQIFPALNFDPDSYDFNLTKYGRVYTFSSRCQNSTEVPMDGLYEKVVKGVVFFQVGKYHPRNEYHAYEVTLNIGGIMGGKTTHSKVNGTVSINYGKFSQDIPVEFIHPGRIKNINQNPNTLIPYAFEAVEEEVIKKIQLK